MPRYVIDSLTTCRFGMSRRPWEGCKGTSPGTRTHLVLYLFPPAIIAMLLPSSHRYALYPMSAPRVGVPLHRVWLAGAVSGAIACLTRARLACLRAPNVTSRYRTVPYRSLDGEDDTTSLYPRFVVGATCCFGKQWFDTDSRYAPALPLSSPFWDNRPGRVSAARL
ncbi:hypothetical protein EJ04DRAFT_274499 [Polyplosphaeria fusca]|uniref:Uncharacterized protein n=1 Tax=Polyplosphaeria fusca TaxID=682080 RepID=A0A9P4QT30_9PLEO|nr:hypothetical protein EJ04DRAFT_274499 [Polyplosphaeria fusca]